MLRAIGVAAAIAVIAVAMCCPWAYAESAEDAPDAAHFLIFSGGDLWRQGAFLYGGSVWAPFDLDSEGPVVKLLTTHGAYRYRSGALGNAEVIGVMSSVALMPGLHFVGNNVGMTFYTGIDRQFHALTPDDVGNTARGMHTGLRSAVEIWGKPTPETMLTGAATVTTIGASYALSLAGGWQLIDGIYLGPEAELFGADNYRQWRFGVRLTGLTLFKFEVQGALGYAADVDENHGLYVRLGVTRKH